MEITSSAPERIDVRLVFEKGLAQMKRAAETSS